MNTTTMNLNEMIAAGQYDLVNPNITEENFPMPENLVLGSEPKLFSFSEDVLEGTTLEEALLAEMDRQGYRPANLWELLDYGSKNPNEQLENTIIALGSEWNERVVGLDSRIPEKRGRLLRGVYVQLRQGCGYFFRFLAVRK